MSWLRVDDKFPRHPKVLPLSDAAFRLHVTALAYCAEHETDGRLTRAIIETLTSHRNKQRLIDDLIEAHLWHLDGANFDIHDYLDWNPSHADQETKRSAACARMNAVRSHSVRANISRTSQEPVITPSLPDPVPTGDPEFPPSRACEDRVDDQSEPTWGRVRFETLWREVVRKSVSGNSYLTGKVADRIAESAKIHSRDDVSAYAGQLIGMFLEFVDNWQQSGKPRPEKSVEAFERHFVKCEEAVAGERSPTKVVGFPGPDLAHGSRPSGRGRAPVYQSEFVRNLKKPASR